MWGILPLPWMLGLMGVYTPMSMIIFPDNVKDFLLLVGSGLLVMLLLVIVHRLARRRLIKHFVLWHEAGLGGLIGRDTNPIPHRYQTLTPEEEAALREERRRDAARRSETNRQYAAARRQGARRKPYHYD